MLATANSRCDILLSRRIMIDRKFDIKDLVKLARWYISLSVTIARASKVSGHWPREHVLSRRVNALFLKVKKFGFESVQ